MKRHLLLILFIASLACVHAETLVLRTGTRVKGTILMENEEVILIRTEDGARFQYPRADVAEVLGDDVIEEPQDTVVVVQEITTPKKASILLELSGGAALIPNEVTGGAVSVDLLVGSHHIGDKHLFIGGGLGYHGAFLGVEKYNFLPIQVALRMPMTEHKHAPMFGFSCGYGIALSKAYKGGIYADVDLGYRCQLNPKTALALTASVQFQQAKVTVTETVKGVDFENQVGRYLLHPGIKLSLYF